MSSLLPPNTQQFFSYWNISSGPPSQAYPGPVTLVVEQFVAYIGAPSAIERSAIVVTDAASPTPGATIWEAHVDIGGGGFPVFFSSYGRWVFDLPFEGPNEWCFVAPTTGSWDIACYGYILQGVSPNYPSQS